MSQPFDLYEIQLFDSDHNFQGILQGWQRLEYWQRINGAWNHALTYTLGVDDPRLELLRDIGPDWIYVIYRTDPYQTETTDYLSFPYAPETQKKILVYEGFHQTRVDQALVDGTIQITLYGQGFTSLLGRRVALPQAGQDQDDRAGVAETVMKQYVTSNLSVPDDADREVPNFSVEPDLGRGDNVSYSPRYTNIMTLIENLAEDGNLCFGVVGFYTSAGVPQFFQFQTREIWGTDRRINSTNPDRGTPCFFNFANKNMEIPILSHNFSEEKNLAYVAGQGIGNQRIFLELENLTATALSQYSRKEAFIDNRGANTQAEILSVGQAYLEQNMARSTLNFKLRQNDNMRWLRDFFLGDIVTAKYFEHLQSKVIREIHVTVSAGEESDLPERIEIEMDDLTDALIDWLAEWTIDYYDPYPFEYNLGAGLAKIFLIHSDGNVSVTNNFTTPASGGGPEYIVGNLGVDGAVLSAVVDPFSPLYTQTGNTVNAWVVTTTGIYRINDVANVSGRQVLLQHTFANPTAYRVIATERGTRNWVLVSSYYTTSGTKACYTTNGGITWTEVTVSTDVFTAGGEDIFAGSYDWYFDFNFNLGDQMGWTYPPTAADWSGTFFYSKYTGINRWKLECDSPSIGVNTTIKAIAVDVEFTPTINSWYVTPRFVDNVGIVAYGNTFTPNWETISYTRRTCIREGLNRAFSSWYKLGIRSTIIPGGPPYGYHRIHRIRVAGDGTKPTGWDGEYTPGPGTPVVPNPTAHVSGKTPGLCYVGGVNGAAGDLYVSTNYGATWNLAASPAHDFSYSLGGAFHFPWFDNAADDIYYWGKYTGSVWSAHRSNGGASSLITPAAGFGPQDHRCWSTSPANRNQLALMAADASGNVMGFRSTNGGDAWNTILASDLRANSYVGCHIPDEYDALYLWGPKGVAYSEDSGATIDDRRGSTSPAAASEVIVIGGW